MKEFIKNNSKIIIALIIVITISLVGFTIAYDASDIAVNIGSGNYNVVYSGTSTLPSAKLQPVVDSEVTSSANASKVMKINFTVKGASTNPTDVPIIYDVSLTNLDLPKELKSEFLKWRLYKNTNEVIYEGNFSMEFDAQIDNRVVLTSIQQDLPSYSSNSDSYSFYIWISEQCTGDITTCTEDMDVSSLTNKTFSGEIRIELLTGSKKELIRQQGVIATTKLLASENIKGIEWSDNAAPGLYATNAYTASDGSTKYHDYRYVGAEPNNYVWFNNDMYRIIGVFDDYTHGRKGEQLVKLISANVLTSASYGDYTTVANQANGEYAGYANNWVGDATNSPANTNILLNQYFYNKTYGLSTDTYGICQNWTYNYNSKFYRIEDCSDIVGYGIDDNAREYIETVTWHLNGMIGTGYNKSQFYECERNGSTLADCYSANSDAYASSTEDEIGLMYVSDYLYASGRYGSTSTQSGGSGYYGNKNWMYKGFEWTITPEGDSASNAFRVSYSGYLSSDEAFIANGVRPTFYLKSSIYITGGEGTFQNPYTISS